MIKYFKKVGHETMAEAIENSEDAFFEVLKTLKNAIPRKRIEAELTKLRSTKYLLLLTNDEKQLIVAEYNNTQKRLDELESRYGPYHLRLRLFEDKPGEEEIRKFNKKLYPDSVDIEIHG